MACGLGTLLSRLILIVLALADVWVPVDISIKWSIQFLPEPVKQVMSKSFCLMKRHYKTHVPCFVVWSNIYLKNPKNSQFVFFWRKQNLNVENDFACFFTIIGPITISLGQQRYTYRVLQTIQMKLILLCVWAEPAVLCSTKTALKFKYEIQIG